MTLCGAYGSVFQLTLQRGLHNGFTNEQTITHEPVYKRVRIFKIRKLPGRAVEPEGATARIRQVHRSIHEITRGQMRHNGAQLKADAKPRTIGRAVERRRLRL